MAYFPYGDGAVVYLSYDWYAGTVTNWDYVLESSIDLSVRSPSPAPTASLAPTATLLPTITPTLLPTITPRDIAMLYDSTYCDTGR